MGHDEEKCYDLEDLYCVLGNPRSIIIVSVTLNIMLRSSAKWNWAMVKEVKVLLNLCCCTKFHVT